MGVSQMLKKISSLAILALTLTLVSVIFNQGSVQAQAKVNTGSLRIVNALPGIGPVDVYLDEQIIANALKPEDVTTYFIIAAGRHALAVRAVSGSPLSPRRLLIFSSILSRMAAKRL